MLVDAGSKREASTYSSALAAFGVSLRAVRVLIARGLELPRRRGHTRHCGGTLPRRSARSKDYQNFRSQTRRTTSASPPTREGVTKIGFPC